MTTTKTECDPFGCSACSAVVFIPRSAGIKGGVCTQEARGCKGEIAPLGELRARTVRNVIAARGLEERPWLTLIFRDPTAGGEAS